MFIRNLKALVLGDVPEAREVFERPPFQDDLPTQVKYVADYQDYRDALDQPETYDLVVIDVAPHGIEVLAQVRELRPACPVMMIGDPDEMQLLLEAKRQGLEAHLVRTPDRALFKDMLTEEILTQLRRFIEPPTMRNPSADEMYRYAQFHNILEPFFVVASRRYLLYVNKAGQELVRTIHGVTPLAGIHTEEWALDSSVEEFHAHLDRAFAGHEVVVERRFSQLSDEEGLRELHFQPVIDPDGRVVAVSIAVHQPARPELQQSRTMQRVTNFAAGVAHVNNNLLNIIMSNADLLSSKLEEHGNHEEIERLARIQRGIRRASRFTHQLQAFSRTHVSRCAPVDLNDVLDQMQDLLLAQLDADIDLVLDLALDLPEVYADRSQLETVLVNLAANANDAMMKGSSEPNEPAAEAGKLVVRTRAVELALDAAARQLTPGRFALIEVSDTGEGIAPELHDRIFEPFFTTRNSSRHVGLGLATVRSILEQCGGQIVVESTPGEGASFHCYLPLTNRLGRPSQEAEPRSVSVAKRPVILVVEDDADLRELLAEAIKIEGYKTRQAASVDSAMEAFHEQDEQDEQVDLVVTDVVLPAGTGTGLAERLMEEQPELKFIFISGYGREVLTRLSEREASRQIFLTKPVDVDTLLKTIEELLS